MNPKFAVTNKEALWIGLSSLLGAGLLFYFCIFRSLYP